MTITILTDIPSPYQVEFCNALAKRETIRLIFARRIPADRPWEVHSIVPAHVFLDDGDTAAAQAADWLGGSDLSVFNWYRTRGVRGWMAARERSCRPWVFWGERPGVTLPGCLGRAYRRLALRGVHRSRAAIWGIGSWAVARYREEFGERRMYANVPYFSDLHRFGAEGLQPHGSPLRFLFSGKLNRRKGVDLLLDAAAALLSNGRSLNVALAGDGVLRQRAESLARAHPASIRCLGLVPWPNLPQTYAEADVLVAPSRYDGWNLAVPEALAAGLPVVSTDRTGAALDLVRPGDNGWLVRAGSLSALCSQMGRVLELPTLEPLRTAARQTADAHSLQGGVARFLSSARQAIESRAGGSWRG